MPNTYLGEILLYNSGLKIEVNKQKIIPNKIKSLFKIFFISSRKINLIIKNWTIPIINQGKLEI